MAIKLSIVTGMLLYHASIWVQGRRKINNSVMFHRYTLLALACLTALGLTPEAAKADFSSSQSAKTDLLIARLASPNFSQPSPALDLGSFLAAQALEPSSPSVSPEAGMLGPGSRGDEVKDLQRRLYTLGYYRASIDGTYGPETELAVSQFQRDVGFAATGFVDPATWQRIEISQLLPSSGSAPAVLEPSLSPDEEAPDSTAKVNPESPQVTTSTPSGAVGENPRVDASASSRSDRGEQFSAQPSPVATPTQAPETPAQESSGWLLWFLLVGIGLLSFGTGLFFAKRSANKALGLDYPESGRMTGASAFDSNPAGEQVSLHHPNAAKNLSRHNGLGANPSEADQRIAPAHAMTVENATTRLSRVNIVDELVSELRGPDPAKRHKAIWELGQRGDSNAVQPLVDLIIDADSKERSLILAALSEIGIRVLKPMNRALAISLQDPNPEVRKNAIRDLTRIYDMAVQVSQMLTHVTEDPDPEVRETAYWALEQLNRIRSIPEADTILSLRDSTKSGNLKDTDVTDFLPEEIQHSSEW